MSLKHLDLVRDYYENKLLKFGATPAGVDWNSESSQELRYLQVLHVLSREKSDSEFSLLDYGCGYGGLLSFMQGAGISGSYCGLDISEKMLESARRRYPGERFVSQVEGETFDFVVASGVFNVRLQEQDGAWLDYIHASLDAFDRLSNKGFAFNCLTSYSDEGKRRDYLYYADPLALFDVCKRKYSRNVALLHDYDLYEFTLIVRK